MEWSAVGLSLQIDDGPPDALPDRPSFRNWLDIAYLIVDYQMPGLNGLEFVSELRKRGNNVPTIMITATSDPRVERRATELGIKRVLKKPLQNQVLLRAIHEELE